MEHVHSLCLIKGTDSNGYPELYHKIGRYASLNYGVIYAVEEDTTKAVQRMSRHGIDVESLIESGALTIVRRSSMYSVRKTGLEGRALLNSWQSLMLKIKRRSKFDGILAIGSAETFFEQDTDFGRLVKYEEMVGKKFQIPLEAICCYSGNAFSKLSLGELVAILNAHHSIARGDCLYREWNPHEIIELVHRALDRALGTELSTLIFKTMKLCYKIGDGNIASNPSILEQTLKRIMGKNAAEATVAKVKDEIKQLIACN